MHSFWERYKALRSGLSDREISERTGIKPSTLSQWQIKDRLPHAIEAVKIAKALDTTVEYLVTGQNDEYSSREKQLIADFRLLYEEKKSHIEKTILLFLGQKGDTRSRSAG